MPFVPSKVIQFKRRWSRSKNSRLSQVHGAVVAQEKESAMTVEEGNEILSSRGEDYRRQEECGGVLLLLDVTETHLDADSVA